jgi:hypothetical protein
MGRRPSDKARLANSSMRSVLAGGRCGKAFLWDMRRSPPRSLSDGRQRRRRHEQPMVLEKTAADQLIMCSGSRGQPQNRPLQVS